MKKIISLLFIVILGTLVLSSCERGQKVVEDFPSVISNLDSYKVTGKLYSMFPSGTKECLVTVYYKQPDFYRVEVDNETLNEKQIIIKNKDGVEILVPSVNKSFKVKSSWPLNSSYPYLLQSLSKDIISDESKTETKDENFTTLTVKTKMFEDANPTEEKIIFNNKTGYPEEVYVYDDNHNLISKFVYEKIEVDININNDLFNPTKTLESLNEYYQEMVETFIRAITYPTYYPVDAKLSEEVIKGSTIKTAIMKFEGTNPFTIIQQYLESNTVPVTSFIDGDIYITGGSVWVINDKTVFFYEQGMEYTIASNSLPVIEMIKTGDSLLVGNEK